MSMQRIEVQMLEVWHLDLGSATHSDLGLYSITPCISLGCELKEL